MTAGGFVREQVLLAAALLFSEKGFHGVSQSDLANVTGVEWSELSTSFDGKEGLFYAAIAFTRDVLSTDAGDGMRSLLPRAQKASRSSKLRMFHREALERLMALDEGREGAS